MQEKIVQEKIDCSAVTLAILAGGEGRRMGVPKGGLQIAGRSILEFLLSQYSWTGPTLLVTAPGLEHPPGWERFAREVSDPVSGQGPLRGVLTALENAQTPLAVISTVDMPCVRAEHVLWAVSRMADQSDFLGVMFHRSTHGSETAGQGNSPGKLIEPFPFACRKDAVPIIRAVLESGGRAMRELLKRPGFSALPAPREWPESVWTNLNRPEDLRQFVEAMR